jgi:hypothetical protein
MGVAEEDRLEELQAIRSELGMGGDDQPGTRPMEDIIRDILNQN